MTLHLAEALLKSCKAEILLIKHLQSTGEVTVENKYTRSEWVIRLAIVSYTKEDRLADYAVTAFKARDMQQDGQEFFSEQALVITDTGVRKGFHRVDQSDVEAKMWIVHC